LTASPYALLELYQASRFAGALDAFNGNEPGMRHCLS